MKLWDKGIEINKLIENFTVGNDRKLDVLLAEFDVIGSLAHVKMLHSIGLLTALEYKRIKIELKNIYNLIKTDYFKIEDEFEDIHSKIEFLLTKKLGEDGKKIHTARSRNDQVLLDIKLYSRSEIEMIVNELSGLFYVLISQSEKYNDILLPGYTHLQIAMPSSFGLWFGAYAESFADDMQLLLSAYKIVNQNPLGSGAGYGSSFPINRQMTTDLLGFEKMNYNVVYAQMGRGKTEKIVAFALGSIANTIAKMAADLCLFMCQNFDFIKLPKEFTTGSSIMPHKNNPDVFELLRAKCNKIQSVNNELSFITNNLTSGYFRDYQILKEIYFPLFFEIETCIEISSFIIEKIQLNKKILDDPKYKYLFSVEDVNREVLKGVPFRDAYMSVGEKIKDDNYNPDKNISYTHEGSIGNLCNDKIRKHFENIKAEFNFSESNKAIKKLLKD